MDRRAMAEANATDLRRTAEARLKEQQANEASGIRKTDADTLRLVHELQVHQIELEMQNEELRESRDRMESERTRYSELYEFAPVGYLTIDREGTTCEANLTCGTLLGIDRSRLVKRRLRPLVSPADLPAFNAFLKTVFERRTKECCEVTFLKEGKAPIRVRLHGAVCSSGEECRMAVVDITEIKRAEEDRIVLSKLESTGILAGGIAHDFNNLLTVILLNLELAQAQIGSDHELALVVADAKAGALMAKGLTQQLITLAKGGAPIQKTASVSEMVRRSVGLALSGSRVRCGLSLADDLFPADVDEGQIEQVLRNLVLNAREAMPMGGVVSVRAENVAHTSGKNPSMRPGDYVSVSISDQGTGIAKEILPKIFDPYFSTKQTGDRKGQGLGLTICHSIMRKHGGAITVESEEGVGSTFRIYIPAARGNEVEKVAVQSVARVPGRILVMDDEEYVRNVMGAILQGRGHDVELTADGQRAIDAYTAAREQGRPFDVVILDLTVRAGMGGAETVQALLQMDPAVKAIVVSGYADDPVVVEYEHHGFRGALAKPFTVKQLETAIALAMDRDRVVSAG